MAHDLLVNRSIMIKLRFFACLDETFRKGGHDDHDVIAVKDTVASKMPFSPYSPKRHFLGGNLLVGISTLEKSIIVFHEEFENV